MSSSPPYKKPSAGKRLQGCLAGGAIGDAVGSFYEGRKDVRTVSFEGMNEISDDTQLTIATCEAIIDAGHVSADSIAQRMLLWYNARQLTGLGASTLKAMRDLQAGAHWGLSGRSGEFAAGNGAAMRIAPLAFMTDIDEERTLIRDVCNITHKNDEAYVGCLAVLYALHFIATEQWEENLLSLIIPQLPDTGVRDNLIKLRETPSLSIREAAELVGTSGHVVQSVPFAIFAAQKIREANFDDIISAIILCGGDTDTNASIAGQIMGAYVGLDGLPGKAREVFDGLKYGNSILDIGSRISRMLADKGNMAYQSLELEQRMGSIKKSLKYRHQQDASNEDIVAKIGVSGTQLDDYIYGREKISDDLITNLMAAYGMKVQKVTHTVMRYITPAPSEDEADEDES